MPIWVDWIPRIFRDLESLEKTFFDSITLIELNEIFKIDPIFFEYSWIFTNKMVFETVFYLAFLAASCRIDMLYMFRILLAYCIKCSIWPRLGELGKNDFTWKTDQKWDFTRVKIAWVHSKSNKPILKSISKSPDSYKWYWGKFSCENTHAY